MSTNYKFYDSCGDTTTTTGTGTLTLTGSAPTGYNSIVSTASNSDKLTYRIESSDGVSWEVGEGVYTTSGTTLTRATVLASSNAGSLVNFGSGTKNVYIVQPAEFMAASVLTTAGDLLTHNGTQPTRLAAGTDTNVLTMVSGSPAWAAASGGGAAFGSGSGWLDSTQPYFGASSAGSVATDPTTTTTSPDIVACIVFPFAATISDLELVTTAQPSAATWTFTMRKNGSNQAVLATMTGSVNTASDHTHSFSVAAGDRVCIEFTTTGANPGGSPYVLFSYKVS